MPRTVTELEYTTTYPLIRGLVAAIYIPSAWKLSDITDTSPNYPILSFLAIGLSGLPSHLMTDCWEKVKPRVHTHQYMYTSQQATLNASNVLILHNGQTFLNYPPLKTLVLAKDKVPKCVLGPQEFSCQTGPSSIQSFLHSTAAWQTHNTMGSSVAIGHIMHYALNNNNNNSGQCL